ncbi:hypothetical protein [Mesorhizobium sp.]|uniref:hypothetical protein n=1 Tax=Mesorhizobium sp. TaxID=1871066 RepID=UPI000FEA1716|nr:hypothetical protein [Mesorhizobium sp.]RWE86946.1 MAG: hypothetical protein EOS49_11830 [Mesorhizobium sp.]
MKLHTRQPARNPERSADETTQSVMPVWQTRISEQQQLADTADHNDPEPFPEPDAMPETPARRGLAPINTRNPR